ERRLVLVWAEWRVLESLEQLGPLELELRLPYQLHLELGFELAVKLAAVGGPHVEDLHFRTVAQHSLAARSNAVLPLVLRLPHAGPLHETERCGEAGVQSQESARVVEGAAVALEVDQHAAPRALRRVLPDVAAHHLPGRRPGAAELEAGIEGKHPRVAAFQLAVGDARAER